LRIESALRAAGGGIRRIGTLHAGLRAALDTGGCRSGALPGVAAGTDAGPDSRSNPGALRSRTQREQGGNDYYRSELRLHAVRSFE
jgi:hypothetical protein